MDLATVGLAAGVFIILQKAFDLLSWYLGEEKDTIYRARLDQWFDAIDTSSFKDLIHRTLVRIVRRANETLERTSAWKLVRTLVTFFSAINVISLFIAYGLFVSFTPDVFLSWQDGLYLHIQNTAVPVQKLSATFIISVVLILGVFDILSSIVTWVLLKQAAKSSSLALIGFHFICDLAAIFLSCLFAWYTLFFLVVFLNPGFLTPAEHAHWLDLIVLPEGVKSEDIAPLRLMFLTLGASAAIPTILYTIIVIFAITAYLTPNRTQKIVTRVVYRVTTDKKPILSQVGIILGGVAAVLATIVKLVGK